MKRLICHFLIAWLALLSMGVPVHAAADAALELGHIAAHAAEVQDPGVKDIRTSSATHEHGHADTCSQSHCGHSHTTGMLAAHLRFSDAGQGVPQPAPQAWASLDQPDTIERPQWLFTTPAVVNL